MTDDLRRIVVKHSDVLHGMASNAIRGVPKELPRPFNSEVVGFWLQDGLLHEEGPLARTDLEFEATFRRFEQPSRIPRPRLERRQVLAIKSVSIKIEFSTTTETERHVSLPSKKQLSHGSCGAPPDGMR